MKILAIDPGTIKTGVALLNIDDSGSVDVCWASTLKPKNGPVEDRIDFIVNEISDIIAETKPFAIAIEEPFVGNNRKTGLILAQLFGCLTHLARTIDGARVITAKPTQAKGAVGNGKMSKEEVSERIIAMYPHIVGDYIGLDATDAIAVGIYAAGIINGE